MSKEILKEKIIQLTDGGRNTAFEMRSLLNDLVNFADSPVIPNIDFGWRKYQPYNSKELTDIELGFYEGNRLVTSKYVEFPPINEYESIKTKVHFLIVKIPEFERISEYSPTLLLD